MGVKAVLYNHATEPIAILDLPSDAYRLLTLTGSVVLPIRSPLDFNRTPPTRPPPAQPLFKTVTVRSERFIYRSRIQLMLFTDGGEAESLLLKSDFVMKAG